jgi:MATE family multidrug resistance protein
MESLSWETRPRRKLLELSWPITLSTLSYSMMTLVDTLLVGGLGAPALAGVGLGGIAAFSLLCFSFGLLRGVKTLVSQAVGAGKKEEIGAYLGAALAAAGLISVATLLVGQLLAELLVHIAASDAAGQAARTYLRLRILGAPGALAYVALREVRYAQSDAQSPMRASLVANAVNVGLACLFVLGLGWGVAGAGAATAIAHYVEVGLLALQQRRHGGGPRGTTLRHLAELWKVGLPTGLQFTLEVGAFSILTGLISALSESEMAAHHVAIQVIQFSFLPAFAVGEAASVLAGQAVGADRDGLVVRASREALKLSTAYTGLWTLALAFVAPLIVAAFRQRPDISASAVQLLHVAAVFQIFDGANIIARAVLRGAADVRYPAWVGVITSWAFTPPLTWLLGYRLGLGALGGWLGMLAEIIVSTALLWRRLERGDWRHAARASRARMTEVAATGGTVVRELEPA